MGDVDAAKLRELYASKEERESENEGPKEARSTNG
jgi:hypothetical protein